MFIFTFPLLVFFFFSLFLGGMCGGVGWGGGAGVGGGIEVEMSIQFGLSGSG